MCIPFKLLKPYALAMYHVPVCSFIYGTKFSQISDIHLVDKNCEFPTTSMSCDSNLVNFAKTLLIMKNNLNGHFMKSRHTVVCQRPRKQKRRTAHKYVIYWYYKVTKLSLLYFQLLIQFLLFSALLIY